MFLSYYYFISGVVDFLKVFAANNQGCHQIREFREDQGIGFSIRRI